MALLIHNIILVVADDNKFYFDVKVVDFSSVFMSAGVSIMVKRPVGFSRFGDGAYSGFFSFTSPLSKEVWTCILGSLVGVSIVVFIVSRYISNYIDNSKIFLYWHECLSALSLNVLHENICSMSLDFHPRNGQSKTAIAWSVLMVPL